MAPRIGWPSIREDAWPLFGQQIGLDKPSDWGDIDIYIFMWHEKWREGVQQPRHDQTIDQPASQPASPTAWP